MALIGEESRELSLRGLLPVLSIVLFMLSSFLACSLKGLKNDISEVPEHSLHSPRDFGFGEALVVHLYKMMNLEPIYLT